MAQTGGMAAGTRSMKANPHGLLISTASCSARECRLQLTEKLPIGPSSISSWKLIAGGHVAEERLGMPRRWRSPLRSGKDPCLASGCLGRSGACRHAILICGTSWGRPRLGGWKRGKVRPDGAVELGFLRGDSVTAFFPRINCCCMARETPTVRQRRRLETCGENNISTNLCLHRDCRRREGTLCRPTRRRSCRDCRSSCPHTAQTSSRSG